MPSTKVDRLAVLALAPAVSCVLACFTFWLWLLLDHETAHAWTPASRVFVHCFRQEGWDSHWFEVAATVHPLGTLAGVIGLPVAGTALLRAGKREDRLVAALALVSNLCITVLSSLTFVR